LNAVEIEEAVSNLAGLPFDVEEFPYAFLEAFDNKETTIRRLRSGATNRSDQGGVLQTNNIHIKVCEPDTVAQTRSELRDSPTTEKARAKFVLATDGDWLEAEDLKSGEIVACHYRDLHEHLGFFLPLAGISTVRQIRESTFDIKATGRLNKLYIELLRANAEWGSAERRHDMNHFMARLIFCFFAEDTEIFLGDGLFTAAVETMSSGDGSNTHEVIGELFRAMNTRHEDRQAAGIRSWADKFPYVNGGLFADSMDVPCFTKMAHSFLLNIGKLDWKKINPDIFGSMIQAVANEEERGELGMHYTSVSNILKVLNPLFLDDLRKQFEEAGDSAVKLLNLRKRMAKIRVFDPACGSGNFLVIAYKEMRKIEAEINQRRGENDRRSDIPLTNFRGIELNDFPAQIARLALIIAEYQCDVLHRGQMEALKDVLPLDETNWITCGNALRLDWLSICPPTGTGVKHQADDLFHWPVDQTEVDFENEGGETYICGNPPYKGAKGQSAEQKSDLEGVFMHRTKSWKSLDYVAGWFMKAADFGLRTKCSAAFVSTNSICQGQQVSILWPLIFDTGHEVAFTHTSFKWSNLATYNAGVTVAIIGISNAPGSIRRLFSLDGDTGTTIKEASYINAYLIAAPNVIIARTHKPLFGTTEMIRGNMPVDDGNLILSREAADRIRKKYPEADYLIRRFIGSQELINGIPRFCLWIEDKDREFAESVPEIRHRLLEVAKFRSESPKAQTRTFAKSPHKFVEIHFEECRHAIVVPIVSSENRHYLPVGLVSRNTIISNLAFAIYDSDIWNMAIIGSRLHWVWIGAVCSRMRTDFRYSNTLGWNTFPVPKLTTKNKEDLTRRAEDILLARETHFPATIADLYDSQEMPGNLREAHDRNDEVLERIFIGRRFRNDTERLEKLFELYSRMTSTRAAKRKAMTQ